MLSRLLSPACIRSFSLLLSLINNHPPPHLRSCVAALLHTCIAPKEQVGLSPYEMLYGKPFVYVNNLFLDPEVQALQSYTMAFGQFQQDICLWGMNQDPKDSKESPLYAPGTEVLIKVWKDGSSKAQL